MAVASVMAVKPRASLMVNSAYVSSWQAPLSFDRFEAHAAGLDGKEPVVIGQDRQDAVRLLIFGCPEDKPPCRQVHRLLPVCSWRMLRVRRPCSIFF